MKYLYILLLGLLNALPALAQRTDQTWQFDLAAGLHSFYAPAEHLKWQRPELVAMTGYRSLQLDNYTLRPYLAYQLQGLPGYNPDMSVLPVSNFLPGLKIHNSKK